MKKKFKLSKNGGKEKNEDSTGVREGAKVVSRDYMIQKYFNLFDFGYNLESVHKSRQTRMKASAM
jgi:hypothetical protein